MKKILYLGSTNKQKLHRLSKIFTLLNFEIELKPLDLSKIPVFTENGRTVRENASLKSSYYSAKTGVDVLSQDDALEVEKNKKKVLHLYLHTDPETGEKLTNEEVYQQWYDLISKKKIQKGTLLKGFAITSKGKTITTIVKIPVTFSLPKNEIPPLCYNPLNFFMNPTGIQNSFQSFTEQDDSKYTNFLVQKIKPFLTKYQFAT